MEMTIREVTMIAVVVRITAAFLLGGILGLERGLKQRPAGLRTHMLVCVGACIIMLTNQYIFQVFHTGDPVRMGAQVVSGIGFLGAGTIMVTKRSQITGLTTAAGLWAAAAVGLALGIGFYEAALVGCVLILLTMTVVQLLDSRIHKNARLVELYAELDQSLSIGIFAQRVRETGVELNGLQLDRDYISDHGIRPVIFAVRVKEKHSREQLLDALRQISGVIYLDEL